MTPFKSILLGILPASLIIGVTAVGQLTITGTQRAIRGLLFLLGQLILLLLPLAIALANQNRPSARLTVLTLLPAICGIVAIILLYGFNHRSELLPHLTIILPLGLLIAGL